MHTAGPHLFFDFDSTLVTKESLDAVIELALSESTERERLVRAVEEITNAGMEGTLPFTESLVRRFAVVPLTREQFVRVGQEFRQYLTEGMLELFRELSEQEVSVFIISGGFRESILPVAELLHVPPERVFTNTIQCDGEGRVIGMDTDNVCYTNDGKAPVIQHIRERYALSGPCCMIGDGANDLKAYELGVADYFCGFTANAERSVIRERAPRVAHSTTELRVYLFSELLTQ